MLPGIHILSIVQPLKLRKSAGSSVTLSCVGILTSFAVGPRMFSADSVMSSICENVASERSRAIRLTLLSAPSDNVSLST